MLDIACTKLDSFACASIVSLNYVAWAAEMKQRTIMNSAKKAFIDKLNFYYTILFKQYQV